MSKYCEWCVKKLHVKFGFTNPQIRAEAQSLHHLIKPEMTGDDFKNVLTENGIICSEPLPISK